MLSIIKRKKEINWTKAQEDEDVKIEEKDVKRICYKLVRVSKNMVLMNEWMVGSVET